MMPYGSYIVDALLLFEAAAAAAAADNNFQV